jgi:hypothetical protein
MQFSKYFWAVMSFDGVPSDGFAKRYELHYQTKKVVVDGFEKYQQFDIINFHERRGGEVGLQVVKNKWPVGWTKAWFYCKVPLHVCCQGGKFVHALRSHMSSLNFRMKPSFAHLRHYPCMFVVKEGNSCTLYAHTCASKHIKGRDVMEEFIACNVWPLAAGISFERVKVGVTPISKLKVPLPKFAVAREDDEDNAGFLTRVEKEARVLVGSYTRLEHEACAILPNNDRLNCILELAGVAYGPRPTPVSVEVLKKMKADSVGKTVPKRPKAIEKKRADSAKGSVAPGKVGVKRPSDANVASLKSVKLSKKTIPHTIASAVVAHGTLMASGLKTVPGTSDPVAAEGPQSSKMTEGTSSSKSAGGASGFNVTRGGLVSKGAASSKKVVAPVKKRRVPPTGPMAGASSKESQDSSPRAQTVRIVVPKIPLRSEPRGQSPPALILRPNPLAGGASTGFFTLCNCVCLCCQMMF